MPEKQRFFARLEAYRPTKSALFWSCAGCVVATMIVGFVWGGWVSGGTARDMTQKAANDARAELAAAVCVHQFGGGAAATAQLASLKAMDTWRRNTFIEEGGWVTLPGGAKPTAGAANICVEQLINAKPPLTTTSG
jgi:hypothetical protein